MGLQQRRKPRFASLKAADMGLISTQGKGKNSSKAKRSVKDNLKHYTDAEKAELAKRYTPEQLAVIEAGEESISLDDIESHGRVRIDQAVLPYFDDMSVLLPVLDKRIQREDPSFVPKSLQDNKDRPIPPWVSKSGVWENKTSVAKKGEAEDDRDQSVILDDDETFDQINEWIGEKYSEYAKSQSMGVRTNSGDEFEDSKPSRLDFHKFVHESEGYRFVDSPAETVMAPALPSNISGVAGQFKDPNLVDEKVDPEGKLTRLVKQTGLTVQEIKDLRTKTLVSHRVVNQTRLGKVESQYILAVAGNSQGMLGIGEGKGTEHDEAMEKAKQAAIRNMRPIPRYEQRTIYGEIEGKVAAAEVRLMARPPGKLT